MLRAILAAMAALTLWAAELAFPPLTGPVVDEARILTPSQEARIAETLETIRQRSGAQVVVVTLSSLQGYDIADYGYRLGRHWGIGSKERNDGVLLIVAPNERAVRIEVGYGLEGRLTDLLCHRIIEEEILPRFRKKDLAGGIEAGVAAIGRALAGPGATERKPPQKSASSQQMNSVYLMAALLMLLALPTKGNLPLSLAVTGVGGVMGYFVGGWNGAMVAAGLVFVIAYFAPKGNRRRGSIGGGGGSGGGGGYSGGGGSFGGGGASGRW
ncbi:TPM domain-containing protein [Hydrogenimonas sp.]